MDPNTMIFIKGTFEKEQLVFWTQPPFASRGASPVPELGLPLRDRSPRVAPCRGRPLQPQLWVLIINPYIEIMGRLQECRRLSIISNLRCWVTLGKKQGVYSLGLTVIQSEPRNQSQKYATQQPRKGPISHELLSVRLVSPKGMDST